MVNSVNDGPRGTAPGPVSYPRGESAGAADEPSRAADASEVSEALGAPNTSGFTPSSPVETRASDHPLAPEGWEALFEPGMPDRLDELAAGLAAGDTTIALGARLRAAGMPGAQVAAMLTQLELRAKGRSKFGAVADRMIFTQAGLEQASRFTVAHLHATRFAEAGCRTVADLGCGIGTESIALLEAGINAVGVEIDPFTAKIAEHNLAAARSSTIQAAEAAEAAAQTGTAELADPFQAAEEPRKPKNLARFEVMVADATAALGDNGGTARGIDISTGDGNRDEHLGNLGNLSEAPADDANRIDGIFLDPARRTAGHRNTKRLTRPDDYSPSLDFAFGLAKRLPTGIKLGPGFDRDLIPDEAEAQWVSVDGQLVETGLWFGALARPGVKRAALLLRGEETHELTAPADAPDVDHRELGEYLYEPDGAVIRARLIGLLASRLDAGMASEGIAYLTGDRLVATPFAQAFRVLERLPASEKQLKRALTDRGIGTLEIKKRGSDVDPAALRKRLRLRGPNSATLFLTRVAGRHTALLAERV